MGIKRFSNTSASYLSYQIAWECDDMNMQAPSIIETKKMQHFGGENSWKKENEA
jgi:hypothetical protein